jgi:hypothetical protein
MELISRPQPLVLNMVFAYLAPTMYLNMYFLEETANVCLSRYGV